MKYLKKFENHAEYESARQILYLPNVSYCVQENEVHYNPIPPMNIITYKATEKLTQTTSSSMGGLHTKAFSGSSGQLLTITSHTFENGIGTIEFDGDIASISNAFYKCSGLKSVNIPNSVTSIGNNAFSQCTSLTSVIVPNNVTRISHTAFNGTPWWNTYSADTSHHYGNIIYINDVAYKATATTITSCEFKNGTVSIGDGVFSGCTSLSSIIIPNGVTSIGNYAFYSCSGLTSVTIPNSVTSIGDNVFYYCTSLTSVTIPNSVTSIGEMAFRYCSSLESVIIGNSVTNIGREAFNGCTSLTSINIPNSVTSIDFGAFESCSGLTSVTIGSGVTSIGNNAFRDCSSLESVSIGNSVTSIGLYAFYYCTSLASITSLATTAPTIQSDTFKGVKTNGTLTVPNGSSGYDVWMGRGSYYLGKYNWTKVEQ